MNLRRWMIVVLIVFGIISVTFYTMSFFMEDDWIEILGVSLITTYFQACIRPLTGSFINMAYHNRINYERNWFKEKRFERKLYSILRVKKWKNLMPTYDKDAFDFKNRSKEELLGAMCQAEIVHELMLVESLLPLFMIIPYGRPLVFILTTLICVIMESVFTIIQRYNRPRMMRLLKRKEKHE